MPFDPPASGTKTMTRKQILKTEKITTNLNSDNFNRFVKNRLNPMLNSLFEANEGEEKDYGKNLRE